jgi:hypothetical protein
MQVAKAGLQQREGGDVVVGVKVIVAAARENEQKQAAGSS